MHKKLVCIILSFFLLSKTFINQSFAFEQEPSADNIRIEHIIGNSELELNSNTMMYSGANIPYYQMTSIAVYNKDVLKKLELPKPNKSFFIPVLLSDNVMQHLDQLEKICDTMDNASEAEKMSNIKLIAELLAKAEENITNEDLKIIRGFDQIDYAFADMMYSVNQLTSENKRKMVYEIADILHNANLKTKIRLSKSGAYDVGLLEKQLGYFLFYYGSVYDEEAFFDTFRFHSGSQLFVANLDNSITLDETLYSINNIFKANEEKRKEDKKIKETPNSSILEESNFSSEQLQQMEDELNRQAENYNANIGTNNTEYKLENNICYEYKYKIENGEKVLDKKRKLKPEEQYYCSGGLDGPTSMPGGKDSMIVHKASKTPEIKSKLIDSDKVNQCIDNLGELVLVYQHKNQKAETNIVLKKDNKISYDSIKELIKKFSDDNGYIVFDDNDKFVVYAENNLYNFYLEKNQKDFTFEELSKITENLIFWDKKERSFSKYEDIFIEGITDLKSVIFNTRTTYLTEPMIYENNRLYISEKEFIKTMRVDYSHVPNGYFLYDSILNTYETIDLEAFLISRTDRRYIIKDMVLTRDGEKYIDIISANRLLERNIKVNNGKLTILSVK